MSDCCVLCRKLFGAFQNGKLGGKLEMWFWEQVLLSVCSNCAIPVICVLASGGNAVKSGNGYLLGNISISSVSWAVYPFILTTRPPSSEALPSPRFKLFFPFYAPGSYCLLESVSSTPAASDCWLFRCWLLTVCQLSDYVCCFHFLTLSGAHRAPNIARKSRNLHTLLKNGGPKHSEYPARGVARVAQGLRIRTRFSVYFLSLCP